MKKAKALAAVLAALMILSSCGARTEPEQTMQTMETAAKTEEVTEENTETENTETENSETETTETEITAEISAEEEKPHFESEKAEKYYDIIMSDMFWKKDDAIGATMLDLHGDGTPEFIVERYNRIHDCYKFGEEKLELLYSFDWSSVLSGYVEDGKTYWWGSVDSYEDLGESDGIRNSYCSEESYGLMEFTDSGPEMVRVIFFRTEEYDCRTDIYKGEMFINGEKYADDHVEDYSKLDGIPPLNYFGWKGEKEKWEDENLTKFMLVPNDELWNEESDVSEDIGKVVNSYCEDEPCAVSELQTFFDVPVDKPVIYLYPEETTEVNVCLDLNGRLVCSYPEYGEGWSVIAQPDGTIFDVNSGEEYSYLFWEAKVDAEWDLSEGFVVKGSDTAEFLREKLSYMGLTAKEYNEFIVYWMPLMQNNKYNLISFQTDAYEEAAKLNITPEPDSVLRVFMTFKPLDEYEDIPEQTLSTFERKGFTVVEWGGAEINA